MSGKFEGNRVAEVLNMARHEFRAALELVVQTTPPPPVSFDRLLPMDCKNKPLLPYLKKLLLPHSEDTTILRKSCTIKSACDYCSPYSFWKFWLTFTQQHPVCLYSSL